MWNDRNILKLVIIVWIIVTQCYAAHVPLDHCTNDFGDHIDYTEIIAIQNRLPTPYEKFQTYHPPFYYLVNTLLVPKSVITTSREFHAHFVKALSVVYGEIVLLILFGVIKKASNDPFSKMIILLFIATTPMFVFQYTTYNNDALANLLSMSIIAISYKLYSKWSTHLAIWLLILAIAGLYTKYTVIVPIIIIIIILCSKNFLHRKLPDANQKRLIIILISSLLFLVPWLVFHNHKHTGKFFPTNFEISNPNYNWNSIKPFIKVISPISIFDNLPQKWQTLSNHPFGGPATKKYDYWSYMFLNTVTQGAVFKTPGTKAIALLLITHFIAYLAAIKVIFKTKLTKLVGCIILFGHLFQIVRFFLIHTAHPFSEYSGTNPFMTYRYFCWDLIGWGYLYGVALSSKQSLFKKVLSTVFILGIIMNVYFILTVSGCSPS